MRDRRSENWKVMIVVGFRLPGVWLSKQTSGSNQPEQAGLPSRFLPASHSSPSRCAVYSEHVCCEMDREDDHSWHVQSVSVWVLRQGDWYSLDTRCLMEERVALLCHLWVALLTGAEQGRDSF